MEQKDNSLTVIDALIESKRGLEHTFVPGRKESKVRLDRSITVSIVWNIFIVTILRKSNQQTGERD